MTALLLAMVTTPTALATAVAMTAGGVALAAAVVHHDDRGT